MALKQKEYSLTKKRSIHQMMDHKSLRSSSCNDEFIIMDYGDEDETIELNKKKKPRCVPWWDEIYDTFNDLNSVVKGLPKSKDAASLVGSSSSTNLHESKAKKNKYERALSLIQRGKFFDLCGDESYNTSDDNKTNQDPLLRSYKTKNNMSHVDKCFTFCSINDLIKETKKGNERSLSSSHDDNFNDLSENEITSSKGYRHVTLDELGVTVEDLKSMQWEAFDSTWDIRSGTMDLWFGGYVQDMDTSAD